MPNYCDYEIRIKGNKKAINRVFKCLASDYYYGEDNLKPSHKHFFRIFEANKGKLKTNEDGTYTLEVWGYCAWSVYCCMCGGENTYYSYVKADHPKTFMGTTLEEQSEDCEIEIFSEEPGLEFSEHYVFKNGKCILDETAEVKNCGYDENGKITEDVDFDEYGGDVVSLNPNRENETGGFLWTI